MRRLYIHFLHSFARSDLMAPESDPRSAVVVAAAIVSAPGLVLCMYLGLFAYVDPRPVLAYFLTMAGLLAALAAILEWDELLPTRSDFQVLGSLPLKRWQWPAAKLLALVSLLGMAAVLANGYWVVLLPLVTAPGADDFVMGLRGIAVQGAVAALACTSAFVAVLGLRCLAELLGARSRQTARLGLAIVVLTGVALCPALTAPSIYRVFSHAGWVATPTAALINLDRWLSGAGPKPRVWLFFLSLVAEIALVAGVYALAWRKCGRDAFARRSVARGSAVWSWYERVWIRTPQERAVFRFARLSLTRSSRHGLYMSAWLAMGAALSLADLVVLGWHVNYYGALDLRATVLAVPLVVGFFLIIGLRHVITLPMDLRANWIFRITETSPEPERLNASRHIMLVYGLVPILLLAVGIAVIVSGWTMAAIHAVFCLLLCLILVECLLIRLRKLPFTCVHVPGRANVKMLFPFYWIAFTTFAYSSTRLEMTLTTSLFALAAAASILATVWLWLRLSDRRWRQHLDGCQFEDSPDPIVHTLFGGSGAQVGGFR